jgi:hypothetical protein
MISKKGSKKKVLIGVISIVAVVVGLFLLTFPFAPPGHAEVIQNLTFVMTSQSYYGSFTVTHMLLRVTPDPTPLAMLPTPNYNWTASTADKQSVWGFYSTSPSGCNDISLVVSVWGPSNTGIYHLEIGKFDYHAIKVYYKGSLVATFPEGQGSYATPYLGGLWIQVTYP